MSHETCYFRVTHAHCDWAVRTFDWEMLAEDHAQTCGAPRKPEFDWDYRVQCLTHNPEDDPRLTEVIER